MHCMLPCDYNGIEYISYNDLFFTFKHLYVKLEIFVPKSLSVVRQCTLSGGTVYFKPPHCIYNWENEAQNC